MSQISVISKLTGVETTTEGTQITLDHSSIVKLNVDRADISGYSRSGNRSGDYPPLGRSDYP
ncbi:BapA prefix-like domain-containing protein [Enterobacter hormaechei]|uniref:BapA prefix-like domain-containing protein n=1 Tax=Enterobacter hormaechei TaxID=158836 RepID=UPI003C6C04B2